MTDFGIAHRPVIFTRHDLDLSGPISHETAGCSVHLVFTGTTVIREVAELISRSGEISDEERIYVAVPASWSLYVHPAVLRLLQQHGGYRLEGR